MMWGPPPISRLSQTGLFDILPPDLPSPNPTLYTREELLLTSDSRVVDQSLFASCIRYFLDYIYSLKNRSSIVRPWVYLQFANVINTANISEWTALPTYLTALLGSLPGWVSGWVITGWSLFIYFVFALPKVWTCLNSNQQGVWGPLLLLLHVMQWWSEVGGSLNVWIQQ